MLSGNDERFVLRNLRSGTRSMVVRHLGHDMKEVIVAHELTMALTTGLLLRDAGVFFCVTECGLSLCAFAISVCGSITPTLCSWLPVCV